MASSEAVVKIAGVDVTSDPEYVPVNDTLQVEPGELGFFGQGDDALKALNPQRIEMAPDEIITGPDSGYAWVIVFISFIQNMIIDGTVFSYAIMFDEMSLAYVGQGHVHPGLIWGGSLYLGCNYLSGPIISLIADQIGFRAGSMLGAYISGFSLAIAAAASNRTTGMPNVPVLLAFYGVLAGFGTGLVYIPSVVCVGYYFEKKRALAVGIAISGTGCGTFVYPFLTKWLIAQTGGWQNVMVIQGLILAASSILSALYRPLEENYRGDDVLKDLNDVTKQMRRAMVEYINSGMSFPYDEEFMEDLNQYHRRKSFFHQKRKQQRSKQTIPTKDASMRTLHKTKKRTSPSPAPKSNQLGSNEKLGSSSAEKVQEKVSPRPMTSVEEKDVEVIDTVLADLQPRRRRIKRKQQDVSGEVGQSNLSVKTDDEDSIEEYSLMGSKVSGLNMSQGEGRGGPRHLPRMPSIRAINRPNRRVDAFLVGSSPKTIYSDKDGTKHVFMSVKPALSEPRPVPVPESKIDLTKSQENVEPHKEDADGAQKTGGSGPSQGKPKKPCCARLRSIRILRMPAFWIISISGFLVTLGFPIPYMFIGLMASNVGVGKAHSDALLSFLGMANTLGRILSGYFSDSDKVNSLHVHNIGVIVAGVATCVLPFLVPFGKLPVFIAYTVIFGLAIACFATLRSILIRDFIGLASLAQAFAFCLSFQGVAAIASSPLASLLFDLTGTYTLAFLMSGALLLAGALICLLLPLASRIQAKWDAAEEAALLAGSN